MTIETVTYSIEVVVDFQPYTGKSGIEYGKPTHEDVTLSLFDAIVSASDRGLDGWGFVSIGDYDTEARPV